jgi:hypothetical protein
VVPPSSTSSPAPSREVACSTAGTPRFPESFLDGPQLTPEEFASTPLGEKLDAFFVGGPGAGEGSFYTEADGFSAIPDTLVLGYLNDFPFAMFRFESGDLIEWGDCRPVPVSGDLIASRWSLSQPSKPEMTVIPIQVDGGACVTDTGTEVVTELVRVDVREDEDNVEITTWTRQLPFDGLCAGVGIMHDAEARLSSPLGDRGLLDGGTVPGTPVDL